MVPCINYGARPFFFFAVRFPPDFIFGVERMKKGGGGWVGVRVFFCLFLPFCIIFGGES